jgi:hypothetical protein
MNFIRTVRSPIQHVLCFPNQDKYLFVEYYLDPQKNIKIIKTNMDELNPFLQHIYKLETDLKLNKSEIATSMDRCFSCFLTSFPNESKKKCSKCAKHLPLFSKNRCPNCYLYLCKECFAYAENNLKNYQDFIIYYQSQTT